MPRYEFRSPGADAGNAIMQLLVQREMQNRQARLDELMQQTQRREAEARDRDLGLRERNLTLQQRQFEAGEAERNRQSAVARASAYDIGDVVSPDDVKAIQSAVPGIIQAQTTLPSRSLDLPSNPWEPETTKVPGIVALKTPTGDFSYRGTPAQREARRGQERFDAFAADPSVPANVRSLVRAQQATGDSSLPYQLFDPNANAPNVGSFEDYVIRRYGKSPTAAQVTSARGEFFQADDRAPQTPKSDLELPTPVQDYLFSLRTKIDPETGQRYTLQRAEDEISRQWPRLREAHPKLSPERVKRALETFFREPKGNDLFDLGDDTGAAATPAQVPQARTATMDDVRAVAQRAGISEAEARQRLSASGVTIR